MATIGLGTVTELETLVNEASAMDDEGVSAFWRMLPRSVTGDEPKLVVTARGIER